MNDPADGKSNSAPVDGALPSRGALVGVDHGLKRIGLAVTDADQTMVMPLTMIAAKSPAHNAAEFRRIAQDYRAVGWVVGLPVHMSGEESAQSAVVRRFGAWLAEATHLPVCFCDERLSSSTAENLLWSLGETPHKKSGRVDGLAAQVILQSYLTARGRRDAPLAGESQTPPA